MAAGWADKFLEEQNNTNKKNGDQISEQSKRDQHHEHAATA
jgi:hypothetical protein